MYEWTWTIECVGINDSKLLNYNILKKVHVVCVSKLWCECMKLKLSNLPYLLICYCSFARAIFTLFEELAMKSHIIQ